MEAQQVEKVESLCFLIEACNVAIYCPKTTENHRRQFKKLRREYRERIKALEKAA